MLKHLTLAEMAALGLAWVNKGARREAFLAIPEIAPLHPSFTSAHNDILAVQPIDKSMSPELRKLLHEGQILDLRHDHLARAGSLALELARELCLAANPPETDRAAVCDRVSAKLYPGGLAVIKTSWLAEAGNTARIETLLAQEDDLRPFLESISLPGETTLLDVADQWIAAGSALGKVDQQRGELESGTPTQADKATIQAARSRWIRVVSIILNTLDLASATPQALDAIRGPVLRASERAGKRYTSDAPETPVLDAEEPAEGAAPPA